MAKRLSSGFSDMTILSFSWNHRARWVGRDPSESSNSAPGPAQGIPPYDWEHCPNPSWIQAWCCDHCPEEPIPVLKSPSGWKTSWHPSWTSPDSASCCSLKPRHWSSVYRLVPSPNLSSWGGWRLHWDLPLVSPSPGGTNQVPSAAPPTASPLDPSPSLWPFFGHFSTSLMSFLYCGAQNCPQNSSWGCPSAELAQLVWCPPWTWLALLAARVVHCWVISKHVQLYYTLQHFFSTWKSERLYLCGSAANRLYRNCRHHTKVNKRPKGTDRAQAWSWGRLL